MEKDTLQPTAGAPPSGMREESQLVTFLLKEEEFGFDIMSVQEIIRLPCVFNHSYLLRAVRSGGRSVQIGKVRHLRHDIDFRSCCPASFTAAHTRRLFISIWRVDARRLLCGTFGHPECMVVWRRKLLNSELRLRIKFRRRRSEAAKSRCLDFRKCMPTSGN